MKVFLIRLLNFVLNLFSFVLLIVIFFISKLLINKSKKEIKNITWFGAYGNGNLGDDLIFYSLKRLLKKNKFNINLSVRDLNKAKNYGVPIFIKGEQFYHFFKFINRIKNSDGVFLGGGGLLEYYYPSKQAYRMIMIYLCPLMIARIFGKPAFVLGIGVNKGRIENGLIRFIYNQVLSESKLIVTRDNKSKEGLIENGVETEIICSYDPVLSLDLPQTKLNSGKKKIGFILWPYFLWPHFYENSENISSDKLDQHKLFLNKINELIESLKYKYELEFLTFHFSDTMVYRELNFNSEPKAELNKFLRQVTSLDLLVTMRYHGQITALLSETPVVSLSVQQKMDELMKNYELEAFNYDVNNFKVDKILDDINYIFKHNAKIVKQINDKNILLKGEINKAYGELNFNVQV
ncbi:polysaccharide pyruvyl transferase family protein [Aestuariivivens insulae]|uniref:polysaccharide pyruvyl transferase family protein n=1 Tax=Aestuariivivens insulae TaxID=1621988 RepID=UPI001F572ACD|nr:polysaccharide pyruvyl transferase family protein [Aestuariivivens insulae]